MKKLTRQLGVLCALASGVYPTLGHCYVSACEKSPPKLQTSPVPHLAFTVVGDGSTLRAVGSRGARRMVAWGAPPTGTPYRELWLGGSYLKGQVWFGMTPVDLGPWTGRGTREEYYAMGGMGCSEFVKDMDKATASVSGVEMGVIPSSTTTYRSGFVITDGSRPSLGLDGSWMGSAYIEQWGGSDPHVDPDPVSGSCIVDGGGHVDVSSGPATVPLNITCTQAGSVKIHLLDSVGRESGAVLVSGGNKIHVTGPGGAGLPTSLVVGANVAYHGSLTVSSDPENAVGDHEYHGVVSVSTE